MNIYHKFTKWYFTKRALPHWCILIFDLCIMLSVGLLARYLHVGGAMFAETFWGSLLGLAICAPIFCAFFYIFHTYHGIIRFSSYIDLYHVGKANFLACIVVGLINHFVHFNIAILPGTYSIIFIFCFGTLFMWLMRIAVKASFENFNTFGAMPIAIYGTQAGGIAIANSINSSNEKQYTIRCFISDRKHKANMFLLGKKIYFNDENIVEELTRQGIRTIIVSPLKSESLRNNVKMIDALTNAKIKIMVMPAAEVWSKGSSIYTEKFHEVEIEDLLPIDRIEINAQAIGAQLGGTRVLITGAAGFVGSELVKQVAAFKPSEMILIDHAETPMHDIRLMMESQFPNIKTTTIVGSVANKEHMEAIFAKHKPQFIFHGAAYKHVAMMEDNPAIAVQNNIYGTHVIADLAVKYGASKCVLISTDRAVNPSSVMGCSKRIGEIYCHSLNKAIAEGKVQGSTQFIITRFGNALGSNGSVIPIFKEQIKNGGPVTVTHPDIVRCFMLTSEACKLILEACAMGKGGEIFIFDMGEPVKIADLAKRMIKLTGAKNIEIQYTGLREGEKLYEEAITDGECAKATQHPKIMIAAVREYDYETACQNEARLLEASRTYDNTAIVKIMKEIVPEYKSMSSKYQDLDQ